MSDPAIPTYRELLYPTLRALDGLQGSAHKEELDSAVIDLLDLSDEQLSIVYPDDAVAKGSKVVHRLAFARSALKSMDALDNSSRGVWSLTATGRGFLIEGQDATLEADSAVRRLLRERRRARDAQVAATDDSAPGETESDDVEDIETNWKAHLLSILQELDPAAFERLAARLMREAGCKDVKVTGRSGDEGIDGVGTLEMSLLSFPVFFQAKRHRKPIGPDKVRELRGALAGRGDKGLLITIGSFTKGAKEEAQRAGAPIDLIDGERLCDLLRNNGLGVEQRTVVNEAFFDEL